MTGVGARRRARLRRLPRTGARHCRGGVSARGAAVALLTFPCLLRSSVPDGGIWPEDAPERVNRFNDLLRDVAARHPGTAVIDLGGMLCPGGAYTESTGGVTVRWTDRIHIATTAGPYLQPRLLPVLRRLGPAPPRPGARRLA